MAEIKVNNPGTNRFGLSVDAYKGGVSTLCQGCGHDTISRHVINAFFEYGVEPHRVAKMSGIGCSSKTPAYFLSRSCGLNAVHGRMPAVATGAKLANRDLLVMGVSGDGDTASIGMGQFVHLMRRNIPLMYIVENNGVYGLTKGQFSATADPGTKQKWGAVNEHDNIDLCALAIDLGCSFVARSFSGDAKQVVPLIKAAIAHQGTALIDIISPCVTFNNHEGSTRSYTYVQKADTPLHAMDFIPFYEEVQVDYDEGSVKELPLPDGSTLVLKKTSKDYDPFNKIQAMTTLAEARRDGLILTGLLFADPQKKNFCQIEKLTDKPLVDLTDAELRPGPQALDEIMNAHAW